MASWQCLLKHTVPIDIQRANWLLMPQKIVGQTSLAGVNRGRHIIPDCRTNLRNDVLVHLRLKTHLHLNQVESHIPIVASFLCQSVNMISTLWLKKPARISQNFIPPGTSQ